MAFIDTGGDFVFLNRGGVVSELRGCWRRWGDANEEQLVYFVVLMLRKAKRCCCQ